MANAWELYFIFCRSAHPDFAHTAADVLAAAAGRAASFRWPPSSAVWLLFCEHLMVRRTRCAVYARSVCSRVAAIGVQAHVLLAESRGKTVLAAAANPMLLYRPVLSHFFKTAAREYGAATRRNLHVAQDEAASGHRFLDLDSAGGRERLAL